MMAHMKERRLTDRIKAQEDIFVNINDNLYKVHDISLDGISFDYEVNEEIPLKASDTLEIFFMTGPILYVENIPYTIVADIAVQKKNGAATATLRRACTRFDDLNFRQIISFNHLLDDHSSPFPAAPPFADSLPPLAGPPV